MSFIDNFDSIVTTTKRNHAYYGKTESSKIASTLSEILVDLRTSYDKLTSTGDSLEVLSSGYIMPSGYSDSMFDLRNQLYDYEKRFEKRIYIEAEQGPVY